MSSLFGGDTAKNSARQQQAYAKKQQSSLTDDLDEGTDQAYNLLLGEKKKLASQPLIHSPFYAQMPGYGINMNNKGATLTRTGETQGFMDRLLAGMGADEASYQDLLSQIRPGFGRLSESMQEQIKNQYAQRHGDLRAQLGRRRVLGSSFADADMQRLDLERDQQMRAAMAESMIQELKMTGDVLKAQTDGRNQAITTAFSQLQFEGNMGINLTNMVMQAMNQNLEAQQDLVKLAANVKMQGKLGAANISGNLANTVTGSFPGYAELQSQIDAGPMNFLATGLGALGTAWAGGGLSGTGLMPAKTSTMPAE